MSMQIPPTEDTSPPAPAQKRSSECARRHSHRLPERGDEMRGRRKAGVISHLGNGLARFLQQGNPPLEPADVYSGARRRAGG